MMNTQLSSLYQIVSRWASGAALMVGLLVLIGWVLEIPALTSMFNQTSMKANTAFGFIVCAISLWLLNDKKSNRQTHFIANSCALFAVLIAALTLGEYVSNSDFGIDQFLVRDTTSSSGTSFPGRMSPITALNLFLVGSALLLMDNRWGRWLSQSLAIMVLIIAGVVVIGHIYGVSPLYQIGIYSSIALHTALVFLIVGIGILCARPKHGVTNILSGNDSASILARRLLPAAVAIPIALGWLFVSGQKAGYYESAFGFALFTISTVVVFATLIWRNSRILAQMEAERGKAEKALSLVEQRAQALIENSWDAIALFGADGSILYGSPSTPQILGYTLEEFTGRNAFEFIHPEDQASVTERLTLSLQQPGEHISFYARVLHKSGQWRWLEGVFTNLLHKPSIAAIVNNYHDFTERKEAEDSLRLMNNELEKQVAERAASLSEANNLLQMLMDHMPDHIYFKDVQSRFIRNSRSQAQALGLKSPSEAVGKSDFDFFPHAQQSFDKEQEIIKSGKPLVNEEEFVVWPNGSATWVSTVKVPLRDQHGQIIGTFGISRDITERKHAEMEIQKAKLELEAANKELEAFSYSVSHDLRAPLRSVDGFSQALLEDYGDILPSDGRNFLERIRSSTQRMAQLIDDLLNLSKVTRAPMKLVPVDLSQLAQGIVEELQRIQPERRVIFNITPDLKVRGDPSLLQAVLENLLNNAWKFTSKREVGEIQFGAKLENGETVYFIRDNGAGFDMTYANKLFGAFQRLHAMTEFPGTGIGLATIQRIINRHGGRIWADGTVNQGATFFFTLPALLERVRPQAATIEKDSLDMRVRQII